MYLFIYVKNCIYKVLYKQKNVIRKEITKIRFI